MQRVPVEEKGNLVDVYGQPIKKANVRGTLKLVFSWAVFLVAIFGVTGLTVWKYYSERPKPHLHISKVTPHKPIAGDVAHMNVTYTNNGNAKASFSIFTSTWVYEGGPFKNYDEKARIEDQYFERLKSDVAGVKGNVMNLPTGQTGWTTLDGQDVLTEKQAAGLLAGTYLAYFVVIFRYGDRPRFPDTELCVAWNQSPTVVINCQNHNPD
jgi:hypothetical protein